jgi:hypothetical protein
VADTHFERKEEAKSIALAYVEREDFFQQGGAGEGAILGQGVRRLPEKSMLQLVLRPCGARYRPLCPVSGKHDWVISAWEDAKCKERGSFEMEGRLDDGWWLSQLGMIREIQYKITKPDYPDQQHHSTFCTSQDPPNMVL